MANGTMRLPKELPRSLTSDGDDLGAQCLTKARSLRFWFSGLEHVRLVCSMFSVFGFGLHGIELPTVHMKPLISSRIPAWLFFERHHICFR